MMRGGILKARVAAPAMTIALAWAVGCGDQAATGILLSMDQALLEQADKVEVFVLSDDLRCSELRADPDIIRSAHSCGGAGEGLCLERQLTLDVSNASDAHTTMYIISGEWVVYVFVLDDGELIGQGCQGPVTVSDGADTHVTVDVR